MSPKPVRSWELERYLLEELPARRMQEISERIGKDEDLRREIDRLKASNAEILAMYPPRAMAAEIERKLSARGPVSGKESGPGRSKRWLLAAPAAAAALLVLAIVLFNPGEDPGPGGRQVLTEGIRIKGEEGIDLSRPQIIIYRKNGTTAEVLQNGDTALAGDLLQLAYVSAGKEFGMIFSLDGNGVITLHYPAEPGGTTALGTDDKVLLANAYELDDAPDFERFFFVAAAQPIHVAAVLEQAAALRNSPSSGRRGGLALDEGHIQFSMLLEKGERP